MINRLKYMSRRTAWVPLMVLLVFTAGCDGLFDIENPGEILDSDLDDPDLIPVLITGLSSDVSDYMDNTGFTVARLTDEAAGSGSYASTGYFRTGWAEQDEVNGIWEQAHEAIWMAELHTQRIEGLLEPSAYQANDDVARAWIFQGVSHRTLGENYCQVVYSDPDSEEYGVLTNRAVAFDSAVASFNRALSFGTGVHDMAAHAGLASVYAAQGNWEQAANEAAMVDDDFVFEIFYDDNDNDNILYDESHERHEYSVYNTWAATFDPQDPRAPFTDCSVEGACVNDVGADGVTTMYRQEKFDDVGDEIPALSGKEARLIRAEAALRADDLPEFTIQINALRDMYGLDPIAEPATAGSLEYPNAYDDGWSILDGERHLTLWLEGRRLWDLHRWDHPFLDGGEIVWEPEPRRDSCMPVPQDECTVNPNFTCNEAAAGTISG